MSRSYTKVEELSAAAFERKAAGKTNRQIGESYGLSQRQIEQQINRQNHKRRKLESGVAICPKGRSPKTPEAAREQGIRHQI